MQATYVNQMSSKKTKQAKAERQGSLAIGFNQNKMTDFSLST